MMKVWKIVGSMLIFQGGVGGHLTLGSLNHPKNVIRDGRVLDRNENCPKNPIDLGTEQGCQVNLINDHRQP